MIPLFKKSDKKYEFCKTYSINHFTTMHVIPLKVHICNSELFRVYNFVLLSINLPFSNWQGCNLVEIIGAAHQFWNSGNLKSPKFPLSVDKNIGVVRATCVGMPLLIYVKH